MKKEKQVIGWREYVDLPEWGIKNLKAKIDTGARSSSLHVENIKELPGNRISFYVVLNKKNSKKKIIAKPIHKGKVKSSIGIRTHRWYVETILKLGNVSQKVRINLVGREEMNFRMLVGRTAITHNFLVDVEHGYLLSKHVLTKKVKKTAKKGEL